MIEFELKAHVPPERVEALRARLGEAEAVEEHEDAYYRHPTRNFAQTDEALRLSRRADRIELTYKGPKLDPTTKARREIVLALNDFPQADALLQALGFEPVAVVKKRRELREVAGFEVALDDVPGLGVFVELERALPEGADRSQAEAEARELLARWSLTITERASYLELLQRAADPPSGHRV